MCGIIGYFGNKEAAPLLVNGLKKMEYRGYDSAGICVKNDKGFCLFKRKGRIAELEKQPELKKFSGNIGIGHTRWATHGQPSQINAHPHLDCKGEIAIVHNGIVENYHSLKELLQKEGHKFSSQTDSEAIVHLIEKFYSGNLEKAVQETIKCLEGTFGLAVLHKKEQKIVAARRGSPLIIGLGSKEIILASDAISILEYTKNVVYLDDNETAIITKEGCIVKKNDGQTVEKKVHEIKWTAEQIEKKGFKHFMLKEIFEQPEAVENTLRGRLKDNKIKLSIKLEPSLLNRIVITACGTSWHSALIGKYLFEQLVGLPVEVDYASEFRYRNPIIKQNDLVIAISQSGETADTLGALEEAKLKGAKTLGIVNVVGSTIAREVDSGIYLHAGPEIGVASTKAFTCQIVALLLLALFIRQQKNLTQDTKILKDLTILPQKIAKILEKSNEIKNIVKEFVNARNFLYLGRGINFPVALEGALKLKEISYIHAEGYPAAEMKHGPIALVEENMPVVFVAPNDNTYKKIISNMEEIKSRKGKIIAVINREDKRIRTIADKIIKVPDADDLLSPIINVIPLQLLAYHIADLKGINVDRPRNLAKSVTVE